MEYQQIGNGPAIDAAAMQTWLSNQNSTISWTNHENHELQLPSKRYRSINGFILPSISYFPLGVNTPGYKPKDPELESANQPDCGSQITAEQGDQMCFDACTQTNCAAVQVRVPQLCYETRIQAENEDGTSYTTKNTCEVNGNKPSHSCTLFYDNVSEADNAYFDLDRTKVGVKYFENSEAPMFSPQGNSRPSESSVKWCAPNVPNHENKRYLTSEGASAECGCTSSDNTCDDPNCCVYRNLLTSEWARHNRPYYNLPMNVTKLGDGFSTSVCPALAQNNECCGWCDDGDGFKLKSCPPNKQFFDGSFSEKVQTPEWWVVDAARSGCNPEPQSSEWWDEINPVGVAETMWENVTADEKDPSVCISSYQQQFNNDKDSAFSELQKCCVYTDQSCLNTLSQPYCSTDPSEVSHGCFGDPNILYVDQSSGDVKACDDNTMISPNNRCVLDYEGKLCTAFPYSCKTGPLYKRK